MYIVEKSDSLRDRVMVFLKANLITLLVFICLIWMLLAGAGEYIMQTFFVLGVFYGFKYVRLFIIARGYDISATIALFLLPFLIGAVIGMFVLAWRIIKTFFSLVALLFFLVTYKKQ